MTTCILLPVQILSKDTPETGSRGGLYGGSLGHRSGQLFIPGDPLVFVVVFMCTYSFTLLLKTCIVCVCVLHTYNPTLERVHIRETYH